jgi:hypothetical protein
MFKFVIASKHLKHLHDVNTAAKDIMLAVYPEFEAFLKERSAQPEDAGGAPGKDVLYLARPRLDILAMLLRRLQSYVSYKEQVLLQGWVGESGAKLQTSS